MFTQYNKASIVKNPKPEEERKGKFYDIIRIDKGSQMAYQSYLNNQSSPFAIEELKYKQVKLKESFKNDKNMNWDIDLTRCKNE